MSLIVSCNNCNLPFIASSFTTHFQSCTTRLSSCTQKKKNLDFDKICGVADGTFQVCTRSLKCKFHSLASKQKVKGRSKPFDSLIKPPFQSLTTAIVSPPAIAFDISDNSLLDDSTALLRNIRQFNPMPLAIQFTPTRHYSYTKLLAKLALSDALR